MATKIVAPRGTVAASLALLGAVIAAGLSYVYFPRATILISPASFTTTVEQTITLSVAAQEPDFRRYALPARLVTAEVEESKTINRSGGAVTEDFARGVVTLHNEQDEEQPLLPKSHLRHEATGVFFLTDQAVRVPPHGQVTMPITAKEKGPAGNVSAGKFIVDRLPPSLQEVVFAESSSDFSGGEAFDTPLSQEELMAAQNEVRGQALEKARGSLTAQAGGAAIRDELVDIQAEEITASAAVGARATRFQITMKAHARAFVVDESDVLSLTLLALRAKPGADEEFISYDPASFKITSVRSDFDRSEARITTSLTGTLARKTEPKVFEATNLAGRTRSEAEEYYKQFPSVGKVEVSFWPFWVTTVPSRPSATSVAVKNPPPS